MATHRQWDRQRADRAEVSLRPLVSLAVQPFVLQFGCAFLACSLVLLAMGLLAVHAAVLDEAAGRAVLELDGVAPGLAAVGAGFVATAMALVAADLNNSGEGQQRRVRPSHISNRWMGPDQNLHSAWEHGWR